MSADRFTVPSPGRPERRPPPILVVGHRVLAEPATPVITFDDMLAALVDDLFASLAVADGVGLAAPQIGVSLAVFVYDCPVGDDERVRGHVINPTVETSGRRMDDDEGCLSVPGPYHRLARPEHATARGVNLYGEPVEVSGSGYFARCLQHENDHLSGRLYVDYLPRNRRRRVLRDMTPFEWNGQLDT